MATPKKKTLIELMLDADVEWPKGAEYAAQDKRNENLYFFRSKPQVERGDDYWSANGGSQWNGLVLTSLCKNWNSTIVTREEYAAAVAAKNGVAVDAATVDEWEPVEWGDWEVGDEVRFDGYAEDGHEHWGWVVGKTYKVGEQGVTIGPENIRRSIPIRDWGFSFSRRKKQVSIADAPVVEPGTHTTQAPTIEQLAEEYMKKLQEANVQQALADEAAKAATAALDELVAAGKGLGLVILVDAHKEPEQPVITNWRDLKVGDVVEITDSDNEAWVRFRNKQLTVTGVKDSGNIKDVTVAMCGDWWAMDDNTTFRFIRRP